MDAPFIAITTDLYLRDTRPTARLAMTYAQRIVQAGGHPVLLPPADFGIPELVERFDGFILSGGDDPCTESFGAASHPAITPVLEPRQRFESQLLETLSSHRPDTPLFGICLGMQMMTLHAGGSLHQHLPESHPTAHSAHWSGEHEILPESERIGRGVCHSHHKQAVESPGSLAVLARAPDGIIEAVGDPDRPFHLGVQWHPERTEQHDLGQRLFDELVQAARVARAEPSRS